MPNSPNNNLLIAFFGDDFTGSTDALESLARAGIRTVLFTNVPTPAQLNQYPQLQAFGVAGLTRSLPTDQITQQIEPAFTAIRNAGAPIVHYKTCSTFDSSPTIGNIGRVIDIGEKIFASQFIPVIVGAPALGRYCIFGNLFARCGSDPQIHRLDRHPSMSRHPVTPMDEADLRLHLAKQTSQPISLLDLLSLDSPAENLKRHFDSLIAAGAKIILIDVLSENHLEAIGSLLVPRASTDHPLFVVGSSGVESALSAHWLKIGKVPRAAQFPSTLSAGPIIAVCGSCSPVTSAQIKWAITHDFVEVVADGSETAEAISRAALRSASAIQNGKSVCIHTRADQVNNPSPTIGPVLGKILLSTLTQTPVRRVAIAGGDTSSQIARTLQIESVEMIGELTRGSPLCKAASPNPAVNGLEITFKGGQIGSPDFFGLVQNGHEFHQERP